jgi:HK97 family phage major capsid protein
MPENKELLETLQTGVKALKEEFAGKFAENEKAQKEFTEKLEGLKDLASKDEVEKGIKEVQELVEELAVKFNKQTVEEKEVTLASEIEAKKADIQGLKGGSVKEVELKADTVRASISGNSDAVKLPGIGQLGVKLRGLYNIFPKVPVSSGDHNGVLRYIDWDEATTVRAADMVAEGALFPESTAKFQEYTIPFKKIGDTLPVTEEFGEDAPSAAAELALFLDTNVQTKIDSQLANGDNTGENLKGLITTVPAYTAVNSGIDRPNVKDLVKKVRTDIVKDRGSKYQPNFVAMNADLLDSLELEKDANGNYIFRDDSSSIGSLAVVEDNNIPDNQLVVGDSRFGRIYEMGGVQLTKGQPNAQFLEDMSTLKARKRMLFLIRNVDQTGFRKVTDVAAALTTLGTAPV